MKTLLSIFFVLVMSSHALADIRDSDYISTNSMDQGGSKISEEDQTRMEKLNLEMGVLAREYGQIVAKYLDSDLHRNMQFAITTDDGVQEITMDYWVNGELISEGCFDEDSDTCYFNGEYIGDGSKENDLPDTFSSDVELTQELRCQSYRCRERQRRRIFRAECRLKGGYAIGFRCRAPETGN